MEVLRTPDDRFADLPGFPWQPSYATTSDGLRVAYLDEGPRDAPVVLLLHGEPSWSYLYRHVVPVLLDAGLRVVAPDLVGFGRSDKPAAVADYTYAGHVEWLRSVLFDALDLDGVTLVCQDWGGLLGLRLVAEHAGRFAAGRRRQHRAAGRHRAGCPSRGGTSATSSPARPTCRSGCWCRAAAPPTLPTRRWWPPTTRRSRTRRTRPARGPSPTSSRRRWTTRRHRRTRPPGGC